MRTNIDIDDALLKEAMKLTGIRIKRHLIEEGLKVLIQTEKRKNLSDLRGKIKFTRGYDHKVLRN